MNVSSKVRINKTMVKQLEQRAVIALEQTAEALHTEIVQAQVIPRDTGNLQNESTFVDSSQSQNGKVSIVSSTPYARRLYFHPEFNFRKTENSNAKGHWFEDWQEGGKNADFCKKAFEGNLRRLMK